MLIFFAIVFAVMAALSALWAVTAHNITSGQLNIITLVLGAFSVASSAASVYFVWKFLQ